MNYYVDSCIWIDYFENRSDGLKPLGEFAYLFFKKCLKENHNIYFSKIIVFELKQNGFDFFDISKEFNILLVEVVPTNVDLKNARSLCIKNKIPFGDAVHQILSKSNKLTLISRDKHLLDFKETKLPEDLI